VERVVKERLVGAAVLMAAAIILIPEMLSGPDREPREQPAQSRSDAPIKTYTIDLSHSPSAQPTPAVVDNRAPPPEESAVQQQPAPQPAVSDQAKPEAPAQEQPASTAATAPVQPAVVEPPTEASAQEHPLASSNDAPTSGRWAVQIGSYARQATAERIAKQLRDKGQSAFVMPVKSGSATLYRVRIGPIKDRVSAEAVLRDVKSAGAAVVPHP
jgi:DedD protein